MTDKKLTLTENQRKDLEVLWFEWGNFGPRSSMRNHKFIQGLLEHKQDYRNFYKPDHDLIVLVDLILSQSTEVF